MDNGFSCIFGGNLPLTKPEEIGLGNRRSILLSYGAVADFLGFRGLSVNWTAQNAQKGLEHVGT